MFLIIGIIYVVVVLIHSLNLCRKKSAQGSTEYAHSMVISQDSDLDNGTHSDVPLVVDE